MPGKHEDAVRIRGVVGAATKAAARGRIEHALDSLDDLHVTVDDVLDRTNQVLGLDGADRITISSLNVDVYPTLPQPVQAVLAESMLVAQVYLLNGSKTSTIAESAFDHAVAAKKLYPFQISDEKFLEHTIGQYRVHGIAVGH